jgi:hypothetical protein
MPNRIPLQSLPDGTVLKTAAHWGGLPFTHYGVVQRAWNGQVLVHHNSKKIGHAATTDLYAFGDGNAVSVHSIPQTPGDGSLRAERARADVARGLQWTVVDNCEDFVSRAVAGRSGSPTRNAFVGLTLFGLAFFFASRL